MRIAIWVDRGVCLVEPSGDIDDSRASELRAALFEAVRLARGGTVLIVEDEITSVCEPARRVVEFYVRACRERGGELAVVSTDARLRHPGRISELGIVSRAFEDLDDALIALSGIGPG